MRLGTRKGMMCRLLGQPIHVLMSVTEGEQEVLKNEVIPRIRFSNLEDGCDVSSNALRRPSWYELTLLNARLRSKWRLLGAWLGGTCHQIRVQCK